MNGPQDLAAGLKRALPRKACITQPLLRHILPARTLPAYAELFKDIKTRRRRQWRGTKAVAGRTLRAALNRPVFRLRNQSRFAVSHISRKTSEIWATHRSGAGTKSQEGSDGGILLTTLPGMLACVVNVCALSPTLALNAAPPRPAWIGCDGSCRQRHRFTRAKSSQLF